MLPGPYEIMDAIHVGCVDLDTIGRELAIAIEEQALCQAEYEQGIEIAKLQIFHEYRERKERLPAEDLRTALAHARVGREAYGSWLTARAKSDALRAKARCVENALSGRQSLLAALKAEAKAVG